MSNLKVYSEFADKWRNVTAPARPTKDELRIIKGYLKKLPKGKEMLILGATPEFRDLGHGLGFNVTLLDINLAMVKAMKLIMKNKGRKEKIIIANWLDMPLPSKSFDIVMSEQSINIIRARDYEKFFRQVKRILKDDGEAILKTHISSGKPTDIMEAIIKYEKGNIKMGDLVGAFQDYMIEHCPKKTINLRLKKVSGLFDEFYRKGKVSKRTYGCFQRKFGPLYLSNLTLSIMPKGRFEKLLKKYFKIVAVEHGREFLCCKTKPIYIVRKR